MDIEKLIAAVKELPKAKDVADEWEAELSEAVEEHGFHGYFVFGYAFMGLGSYQSGFYSSWEPSIEDVKGVLRRDDGVEWVVNIETGKFVNFTRIVSVTLEE